MARLAISSMSFGEDLEEQVFSSGGEKEGTTTPIKGGRWSRNHAGGLLKCSQCGTDVKIHVSPKRNPHSGKLGRTVNLKDHDLCRRCWRQMIRSSREEELAGTYQLPEWEKRREVA